MTGMRGTAAGRSPVTSVRDTRSAGRSKIAPPLTRRLPRPERERLPRPAEGLDGPLRRRRDALPAELSRLATDPGAGARAKCLENLALGRCTTDPNNQRELSLWLWLGHTRTPRVGLQSASD